MVRGNACYVLCKKYLIGSHSFDEIYDTRIISMKTQELFYETFRIFHRNIFVYDLSNLIITDSIIVPRIKFFFFFFPKKIMMILLKMFASVDLIANAVCISTSLRQLTLLLKHS